MQIAQLKYQLEEKTNEMNQMQTKMHQMQAKIDKLETEYSELRAKNAELKHHHRNKSSADKEDISHPYALRSISQSSNKRKSMHELGGKSKQNKK